MSTGVLVALCLTWSPSLVAPAGAAPCASVRPVGTWTTVDLPFATARPDYSFEEQADRHPSARLSLAADPSAPGRLFVTDGEQLMRSVDGGCTWARVFATGTQGAAGDSAPYEIVQILVGGGSGPNRPVFALLNQRYRYVYYDPTGAGPAVTAARLYRSLDGGATFAEVPIKGPAAQHCDRTESVPSALLAASATDARRLYLACRQSGAEKSHLYVTTNAGDTWSPATNSGLPERTFAPVTVDPKNPRVLYAVTPSLRKVDYVGKTSLWDVPVWSSSNGGATWSRRKTASFLDNTGNPSRLNSEDAGGVTTVTDGKKTLVAAWYALGLVTSRDGGRTWKASAAPPGYDVESAVGGQTPDTLLVYLRPIRRASCPAALDSAYVVTGGPMFDRYTTVPFIYRPATGAWQPAPTLRVAPATMNSVLGPALRVRGSGSSVRYVSLESGSTAGCTSDGTPSPAGTVSDHLVVYHGPA